MKKLKSNLKNSGVVLFGTREKHFNTINIQMKLDILDYLINKINTAEQK